MNDTDELVERARALIGPGAVTDEQLQAAVLAVTEMVRAYTRDRGFTIDLPDDDVAAVITTSTARLASNPEAIQQEDIAGEYAVRKTAFSGWSLAELAVLNRHRQKAA
jgi:hypothetical protein